MQNGMLDGACWRAREIWTEFDLMAMLGRQLCKDNERLDLSFFVLSKKIPSVHHVPPWGDIGDMDLLSFAACQPILNALIGLLNLFLCMTDLSCNVVIM